MTCPLIGRSAFLGRSATSRNRERGSTLDRDALAGDDLGGGDGLADGVSIWRAGAPYPLPI